MNRSPLALASAALLSVALTASCVTHSHATEFHGLPNPNGDEVEFQSTTSYGLHFLFSFPMWGDARRTNTVGEFNQEAARRGADNVDIQNTSGLTYWFILPPISFFIHPVVTTVEGSVAGASEPEDE